MSASLILHPADPDYAPASVSDLAQMLHEIGLIGTAWGEPAAQRFLIGEHFLQLVSFMGCAPAIELAPGNMEQPFCHAGISPITSTPTYLADSRDVVPRCPHCRQRIETWPDWIEAWQGDRNFRTGCPACHVNLSPLELDWRHAAGFARVFISIFNIYPREALPTEALLIKLQQATAQTWNYFYQRQD
ncbi:MAG: phage terminase large subunit family protein [Proteobacteria bacterium]|jgi:hypothetical protein|nr:phage terminase large subunit family protein [Pseudomonadota bacterium]MCG6934567.1 phage terminase large subunit family protein [Pseudomonadota bacterium]